MWYVLIRDVEMGVTPCCHKAVRKDKEISCVCKCVAFIVLTVLSCHLRLGLCTLGLNRVQCCKSTCVAVKACTIYY